MHRTFRKLLDGAVGISEFIIAVNLDVRGFSLFSKNVESPETALFIKKVYIKLIDDYFHDASFFKPTGDGLLITVPYTPDNLQDMIRRTVNACFDIVDKFGSFCANDPMINFKVPKNIGIGLSRGTACRIANGGKTLDYSGRVLNLASRLMDFARPSGIVFDADFGVELLSDEHKELFKMDSVFIKGIAETAPVDIWFTKDFTELSPVSKQPIEKSKWKTSVYELTLRQMKERPTRFDYSLRSEPTDSAAISVQISHPGIVHGKKRPDFIVVHTIDDFKYHMEAEKPFIQLKFDAIVKTLVAAGVKYNLPLKIIIQYPEK